jgi:nitroreductase
MVMPHGKATVAKRGCGRYAGGMDAFNDRTSTATLLATRRSGKARDLVAPGPDAVTLRAILSAAMRVPDHGKLAPWRFVTVADDRRAALSEAMVAALAQERPGAAQVEIDGARGIALQAPCLVVVLARPDPSRPIPEWEQLLSVGAACGLLCVAAHAHGFVANWLTGWAAYSPGVTAALAEPGERIAGYFFIGSQARPLEERPRPDYDAVVRCW